MTSLPPLVMTDVYASTARYWSFHFEGGGWAIFTVNDATGEFSVQSDWGNYAYRWNTNAIGNMTLLEFIGKEADCDYITRKFAYDKPDSFKNQFSPENTRDAIKEWIKDDGFGRTKEKRTELLLKQLKTWYDDALRRCQSFDEAHRLFTDDRVEEELYAAIERPADFFRGEPSDAFLTMRDRLLPFFKGYLQQQFIVAQRASKIRS